MGVLNYYEREHYHSVHVDDEHSRQLDPESFDRLFSQARPVLRVIAGSECGFAYCDDVVQHAAVIALEQLHKFEPGTNFTAWTAAIVRGVARNQRRSEQRRSAHRSKLAWFTGNRQQSQDDSRVGQQVGADFKLSKDFDKELRDALDELSPEQRSCMLLRSMLEHSYSEIGEILDMPAATARSHVYRARLRLLDILGPDWTKGACDD